MRLLVLWLRGLWLAWWDRLYERIAGPTVVRHAGVTIPAEAFEDPGPSIAQQFDRDWRREQASS